MQTFWGVSSSIISSCTFEVTEFGVGKYETLHWCRQLSHIKWIGPLSSGKAVWWGYSWSWCPPVGTGREDVSGEPCSSLARAPSPPGQLSSCRGEVTAARISAGGSEGRWASSYLRNVSRSVCLYLSCETSGGGLGWLTHVLCVSHNLFAFAKTLVFLFKSKNAAE